MKFKNGWRNIAFALLIVSHLPLVIFFYLLFSGKLDANQSNQYLIDAIIIYVLAILFAMIIAEYKIVRPRNERLKANSSHNQEAIDSSVTIFRSMSMKKKTMKNIQGICIAIISLYALAWILLHYFNAYNTDILTGIESIPLVISAIVYTITRIYLQKHQPHQLQHWAWNILLFIFAGFVYYDFAYSPLPEIPAKYIWTGPVFTIIVFIVALLDMNRGRKKLVETA